MRKVNENSNLTKVLVLLVAAVIGLSVTLTTKVATGSRTASIEYTKTISEVQLSKIEDFVRSQEERLDGYAQSNDVKTLLLSSKDRTTNTYTTAQRNAQSYLGKIAKTREQGGIDEGIYISTWSTEVLAHTNPDNVGVVTRSGDSLVALQTALKNVGDAVYDVGIILSPVGNHEQILSLYRAVYDDNGNTIGIMGMGVYVDTLQNTLGFSISDKPNAKFAMLNAKDGKYIFNQGMEIKQITKDAEGVDRYEYISCEDVALTDVCKQLVNGGGAKTGVVYYDNKNNEHVAAVYAYSQKYNWLFRIEDSTDEMFAMSNRVLRFLIIFSILITAIFIIVLMINHKMVKTARSLNRSIEKNEEQVANALEVIEQDELTKTLSRASYILKFSDKDLVNNKCTRYYIHFCCSSLREVNIRFGEGSGDMLLVNAADVLKLTFGEGNVYRTDGKEFTVVVEATGNDVMSVQAKANDAFRVLSTPTNMNGENYVSRWEVAMIKKSSGLSVHTLTMLKDMAKNNLTAYNNISYADLD